MEINHEYHIHLSFFLWDSLMKGYHETPIFEVSFDKHTVTLVFHRKISLKAILKKNIVRAAVQYENQRFWRYNLCFVFISKLNVHFNEAFVRLREVIFRRNVILKNKVMVAYFLFNGFHQALEQGQN